MSKLPKQHQFVDLSDYGRFPARQIAVALKNTKVTPIHVTYWFIISGMLAIFCILNSFYFAAAFFLILKSILDAADGELSRLKNTPSYIGRYLDSIADIILNFLFLLTIWYVSDHELYLFFLAFISIQLQGTLYNYYYVILRNSVNGDSTSRVFEDKSPVAMQGEDQNKVDRYFNIFNALYKYFDKVIYHLDKEAVNCQPFPKWFMTALSALGLGFQLLLMSLFLILNRIDLIIPFFIAYSLLILILVATRKSFLI